MLYSIDGTVVFGRTVPVPTGPGHVFKDIFGAEVPLADAALSVSALENRDRAVSPTNIASQVLRNMELGNQIIALWREYVVRVGLHGQGIAQLQSMAGVVLALVSGCLAEAAVLISILPEDTVVTAAIKAKFSAACTSADHITYAP